MFKGTFKGSKPLILNPPDRKPYWYILFLPGGRCF